MTNDPLSNWIPLFLSGPKHDPTLDWCYMGDKRFTESFCSDTIKKLAAHPFNQLFRQQGSIAMLRERAHSHPGLPLKGMIFHMSRCGSTLAAQWLTALPDSVVLSEPELVDTLLQYPPEVGDPQTLNALLNAIGQPRRAHDRQLFLKTDCWHIAHIDRLLAAFPNTPWIFLYRNPIEVLVSHQRMPGWQMVPGSLSNHGYVPPDEVRNFPLSNGAWILSTILKQAHQAILRHHNGMLLNYSEFPSALTERMAKHFNIPLTAEIKTQLEEVTGRNAKHKQTPFQPDATEKRSAADPFILELAKHWLDEPYQALEELRKNEL